MLQFKKIDTCKTDLLSASDTKPQPDEFCHLLFVNHPIKKISAPSQNGIKQAISLKSEIMPQHEII